MTYRIKYASFGSVSHGTMRTEDLLESFSDELEYQMKRQPKRFPRKALRSLVRAAQRALSNPDPDMLDCDSDTVNELIDALNEFAPPYAYFGANDGDGSDYGYRLSSDMPYSFDGLKVDDTSEVPRDYRGEVLHVNDHGNMTLYIANGRGRLTEVWGVV